MPTNPPRMRVLMDDPLFRAYMKRIPPRHSANASGKPWRIWVNFLEGDSRGKWATGEFPTYRDIWPVFTKHFREVDRDVTITSKRMFYAPPGEWYQVKVRLNTPRTHPTTGKVTTHRIETRWRQTFHWDGYDLSWCGRCRRPSYWMPLFPDHHALRRLPAVSTEDNIRCIICGVRWIAQPGVADMEKIEPMP